MKDVKFSDEHSKHENDGTQKNAKNSGARKQGGFLSSLFTLIFWLSIVSTFLWNWDSFWQTNIDPLTTSQQRYFPLKFAEEQKKTSHISRNNKVLDEISEQIERLQVEKNAALESKEVAQNQLQEYLDQENEKCRYYDTSLRMIELLTKKYSEDELKRTLSCTSPECENILYHRPHATSICG